MVPLKDLYQGMFELFVPPKKFASENEESLFLLDYANKNLLQRRLFLIVAIVIWVSFSYWDYHHRAHHPDAFTHDILMNVVVLRGIGALLVVCACRESFSERFKNEQYAAAVITSVVAAAILCLVLMMSVMPAPLNYQYYFVGIILVLFFQYGTMALLARYSLVTTVLSVVLLAVQDALHAPLGIYFFPSMFYLIAFASIGWAVSIRFECSARDNYSKTLSLRKKNASLEDANARVWREKRKADVALQELFDKEIQNARQINEKTEATTRFVRAAYHDTMQPLASITTLALVGDRAVTEGEVEKINGIFKEIATSAKEINLLFKGLRDVFMIGETSPILEPVSLNSILEELEHVYRSLAEEKNITFKVLKRQNDIHVLSDKNIIKRVVSNLISNAIKYTGQGGVLVGSVAGKTTVRVDVIDTGKGIPAKFSKKIFDEFFQVDNPGHDSRMGLGLGLSIVRNLIDKLPGHRISFSTKENKGTRFSIDCPLSQEPVCFNETIVFNGAVHDVDMAGLYIIIVDDDVRILNSLAKALGMLNVIVGVAHDLPSVQALLENAPDRHPDVLITDYKLAGDVTGLSVLDLVREFYSWAKIPAILFSAELSAHWAGQNEMLSFVSKGDDASVLINSIQESMLMGRAANASILEDDNTPNT